MATKVVYFSRSGSCKSVAEHVAQELKLEETDTILAIAPVWAGMMAQPMRQFLTDNSNKTDLILLSNSSGSEMSSLECVQSKRDIIIKSGNREEIIKQIIKSYK